MWGQCLLLNIGTRHVLRGGQGVGAGGREGGGCGLL